ncbi:hypothetical protein [Fluviicola taffensis]|uniref:hypothetical protein n=1 Tax=Fluviicola taffensis TaxID=191579 RepID=UPI003138149C
MAAIETITNTLTNSPLSSMIENMGISVAKAQAALDSNSIEMLKSLASSTVEIGEDKISLLNLGFVPSFYAFTEATFDAKMDFSLAESTSFNADATVSVQTQVVSATVSAGFARKFDQSASASSSIAARMVSLPPPENLVTLLKNLNPVGLTTTT